MDVGIPIMNGMKISLSIGLAVAGAASLLAARYDKSLQSGIPDDAFGSSIAFAGDVDGDGHADVLVGAPEHDGPVGLDSGRAYLFSGATGAVIHQWEGESVNQWFGHSVTGAGDVDSDGIPDVTVGVSHRESGGTNEAKAYLFSGRSGLLIRTWEYDTGGDPFITRGVTRVAGPGDLDGDGTADVAVGVPAALGDHGFTYGQVHVYSGATGQTLWKAERLSGAFGGLGSDLDPVGDVDGDGTPDLVASDPVNNEVVALSGSDGSILRTWTKDGSRFGRIIADGGDWDRDGIHDILVSIDVVFSTGTGALEVYSGRTGQLLAAIPLETGWRAGNLSSAGDFDGDGRPDAALRVRYFTPPDESKSELRVYSGRTHAILFRSANDGGGLAGGADVDGDGARDFAFQDPRIAGVPRKVLLYLGQGGLPAGGPRALR